jgi:hypothetical protein
MANVDNPNGLTPVRYVGGGKYNGATNRYYVPATDTNAAVYVGGLVKLIGGADADGIPTVTGNVATANPVCGVVVSVEPVTADSLTYRANSTARYVNVADDPDLLFEVQEDGTTVATVAGATARLTGFTSGSTVTGRSAIEISTSDISETSDVDDDVQLIRMVQRPDNAAGANGRWLVRLNLHQYSYGTVGV